jgi:hypothetical protein
VIPQDKKRSNVIHDLDGSEMGEWEKPSHLLDEFDRVGKTKWGKWGVHYHLRETKMTIE